MGGLKILLIDGEECFGKTLKNCLKLKGYQVTYAKSIADELLSIRREECDLCIIDEKLINSRESIMINTIRMINHHIPMIFLTEDVRAYNRLLSYKLSLAYSCHKNPFELNNLLQKIKLIINTKSLAQGKYEIGGYTFNFRKRELSFKKENSVKLTRRESKLLELLLEHKNDILPKELALTKIWREDTSYTARSMITYIVKLRKHLLLDEKVKIVTIYGKGYKLVG